MRFAYKITEILKEYVDFLYALREDEKQLLKG
jgi:hypothetical protein